MERLTHKERLHTRRVLRVLEDAKKKLYELAQRASDTQLFPKTSLKAYAEVSEVLNRTELRVNSRNAEVV